MADLLKEIEKCQADEERYQFDSFSNEDAWNLGSIMIRNAMENKFGVTIQIIYKDQILFHVATKGASKETVSWIKRKCNTVMYAEKSSLHFSKILAKDGKSLVDLGLVPEEYVMCGGGFPLLVKGEGLVGSIAVSGLVDTEDHQIMVDALEEYLYK